MTITQDDLINTIAQKEDIDVATVRKTFNAIENTIFDYLSSVTPTQPVVVKLLNGLKIKGDYMPEQNVNRGAFHDSKWEAQVRARAHITR